MHVVAADRGCACVQLHRAARHLRSGFFFASGTSLEKPLNVQAVSFLADKSGLARSRVVRA